MNLTTEQIQAILDGAPEGATHYQSTTYLRYDSKSWVWWSEEESGWCFVRDESLGWAQLLGGHHGNLSDLREILTLCQEVECLKAQQSEAAATVERLRDYIERGSPYNTNPSKCERTEILQATPSQNLNAVRRDAFIEGFNAGFTDCWIVDEEEHADAAIEIANQRYPD